ncbi:hypothetical protein KW799_02530 [Candidatus Parcubacteria bacterium]|nr:hypothetical protein [Candidatus Parcubacteria bacterium]
MKETKEKYVTISIFEEFWNEFRRAMSLIDDRLETLDEKLSSKIDDLAATKADREEVFALHKKVAKIERKAA